MSAREHPARGRDQREERAAMPDQTPSIPSHEERMRYGDAWPTHHAKARARRRRRPVQLRLERGAS